MAILDGKSLTDTRFDVPAISNHLISCLVERDLWPFPKVKQDNAKKKKIDLKFTGNFVYFNLKTFFLTLYIFATIYSKIVMII